MNKEENLPPHVEYWLSPDTKHDCYFNVGSELGPAERIGAFKAFLIGYSEPLRAMLQDSELAEHGDISVVDIEPKTFKVFLKCLYMDLNNTIIENLSFQICCELLYVADKYLVTLLKEKVIVQCLQTLSSEISCIIAASSSKVFLQETCLRNSLTKIVQSKIQNIVSSGQFLQIPNDSLLWILQLDPLNIDEISLWQAVLKWAKNKTNSNDGNVLRECTLKLLKFIRFCSMSVQDFCKKVIPVNVLTAKEVNQICNYHGTNEVPNMDFICNTVTRRHSYSDISLEAITPVVSYCWCVSDILNFTGRRTSSNFEFLNFDWRLVITRYKDNANNELGFFLECEGSEDDPSWECCVKAELTLFNHEQYSFSKKKIKSRYCIKSSCWGYKCFHLWSEVLNPTKGFVENNSIIVLATVVSAEK